MITFTLAVFLALLLSPLVTFVDHFTSVRIPRTVALMVVYVLLIAAFAAALIGVVSAVASDARTLSGTLPEALRSDPLGGLPLPAWLDPMRDRLGMWLHDRLDEFGKNAISLTGEALRQLATGLGAAVSVVVVPILAFFFIKDGKALRDGFIHSVPRKHQLLLHQILQDLHRLLSQYLRALVILSIGGVCFLFGIFERDRGALRGAAGGDCGDARIHSGGGAVRRHAADCGRWGSSAAIRIGSCCSLFFVIYRLGQDYVLQPMLLSAGMRMHPLLIIFGSAGGRRTGRRFRGFSFPFR